MRILRKVMVLGLAGLGVYKAWEMASPMLGAAREKAANGRGRVEPALRDAMNTVQSPSKDAAGTLLDASKEAADSLAGAVSDTDSGSSNRETRFPSGGATSDAIPTAEGVNFGG